MDFKEKKTVSIVVPVYNEEAMIENIYNRTVKVMNSLDSYEFELVFFDDCSSDNSRGLIRNLCQKDSRVKAVFYRKNIGYSKNIFYCVQQAKGDCAILLHADLQNPPEVIPDLVKKWEQGAEVVTGVKNKSRENKIMFFFRTVFYFIMNFVFAMNLVPHATDFGLFDRCFIDTILNSNYRDPFLRGIIFDVVDKNKIAYIDYIQDRRNAGKTKFNVSKYYDFAVCGIVSFSRKLPRRFIAVGIAAVIFSFAELLFNFIPDCVRHTVTCISDSLIIRFIFLMSALLTILISIAFEYIISVQKKLDDKPFVSEEERIAY